MPIRWRHIKLLQEEMNLGIESEGTEEATFQV